MAQDVRGKTAIVTGAGSGINLEFARLLLKAGANVVFADLNLRPEATKLIEEHSKDSVFIRTDVSSWTALQAMFDEAVRSFGQVDIVCPGAGLFEPPFSGFWYPPGTASSVDSPDGDRYKIVDVNYVHPMRLTQMAISHFLSQNPPPSSSNPKSVVHIISIAAEMQALAFPFYLSTKAALASFVRCMGDLENLHGIRVTGVLPGIVKTPLWLENPEKLKAVSESAGDSWVTPEEVAALMLACVNASAVPRLNREKGEEEITIQGGSCIEILAGTLREVPRYNSHGPFVDAAGNATKGASISEGGKIHEDVVGTLKPGWGQTGQQT
ncbi:hypothetical protein LTR56_006235 [Elasticomyces elasticus]|nr:hypothetical protein LTR56_006235 [Elasticomyces elasticus]KAK3666556.1 hypothetical protein LTR22_002500 [Elasticomyces elasticus]KAK4928311.1 hypothetical protein LTR49_004988 [Elasticomyces elasticus]KAK5763874.1 hypothetical protein LTS12_005992 [Elasticomyces elasticus]